MGKKITFSSLLILLMISLTGCLLVDRSTTLITDQEEREIRVEAEIIADDFFNYNQYDPQGDDSYNPDGLIGLINTSMGSRAYILTIDPMVGAPYPKRLDVLKSELHEQGNIFSRQQGYRLKFEDPEGDKSYRVLSGDGEYTSYTAIYDVLFKVFEEREGRVLLTDNGVITFELANTANGWKIDYITIDYQELGNISLND